MGSFDFFENRWFRFVNHEKKNLKTIFFESQIVFKKQKPNDRFQNVSCVSWFPCTPAGTGLNR